MLVHAVEEKIYRTARLVHKKQGGKELCARRVAFRSLIYARICERAAIMRGAGQTFIFFWRNARALGQKEVLFKGRTGQKSKSPLISVWTNVYIPTDGRTMCCFLWISHRANS
jgi:hypothetical protein